TSSQTCSSRWSRDSRVSSPRPSTFWDRASRPRRRTSRPTVGAGRSGRSGAMTPPGAASSTGSRGRGAGRSRRRSRGTTSAAPPASTTTTASTMSSTTSGSMAPILSDGVPAHGGTAPMRPRRRRPRPGRVSGGAGTLSGMTWTAPEVTRRDWPQVAPEREMLDGLLDWHRQTPLHKCSGLTEADLAAYRETVERSRAAVARVPLERTLGDRQRYPLRWVYLHMIEEYARHNGRADLLRERIDGATGGEGPTARHAVAA